MSNIVWSPDKGWHNGQEVAVRFDHGRIISEPKEEKMSTIISTNAGPRSSCCNAEIEVQKDYTDTHVFVVDDVDTDDDGHVIAGRYSFVRTYDGIDSENWSVTCRKCGQEIENEDIDLREG